jgi:hypothetical protein
MSAKCTFSTQRSRCSSSSVEVVNALITDLCASKGLEVSARRRGPVFELSEGQGREAIGDRRPIFGKLLVKRPLAAVALIPQPVVLFAAGATAGALGKLLT